MIKADQTANIVRGVLTEHLDKAIVFAIITATLMFGFLLTTLK